MPPTARILAEELAEIREALAGPPPRVAKQVLQALEALSADLIRGSASSDWDPALQLLENAVTGLGQQIRATCQSSLDHRAELLKVVAPIVEKGFGAREPVCSSCTSSACTWNEAARFHELCRQLGQEQITLRRARHCYAELTRALSLLQVDNDEFSENEALDNPAAAPDLLLVDGFRELVLTLRALLLSLLEHAPCPSLRHISLNLLLKMGVPFAKMLVERAFAGAPSDDLQATVRYVALDDYPLTASECAELVQRETAAVPPVQAGTVRRRLNLAVHHILRNT